MVMGRNGMGRNGYGPKWSWAEMVMGRNDPEPLEHFRRSHIAGCTDVWQFKITCIIANVIVTVQVRTRRGRGRSFLLAGVNWMFRTSGFRKQDNPPTRQLTDTVFETIHRQILRQFTDTFEDNSPTLLIKVNDL